MAIFQRLTDLFKSNINDLIDKAEDPEKMVKQIIIDMEEQIKDATQALGQAMAGERQAYNQLEKAKQNSAQWEQKAKMALSSGNQELAKKALQNKVNVDSTVTMLENTYNNISAQTAELKNRVDMLKAKLDEARMKQNVLITRAKMADAQKGISQSLNSDFSDSAFSKLDKMERKIEEKEAQAQAFSTISGDSTFANDEFKDLETNSAVDSELQRLMAEMNGNNQ